MDLSSIFQAVLELKSAEATASVATLKIGDRLTGRVLHLEADGRALIDLGRFRVRAQIGFPVQAGQALKMQVVQSGTPLHLQADVQTASRRSEDLPRLDFAQVLGAPDQQQLVNLLNDMVNLPKSHWGMVPFPERIQAALAILKSVFDTIPVDRPTPKLAQWLKGALEDRGVLFEKKMADAVISATPTPEEPNSVNANHFRTLIAHDLKPQLLVLKSFFDIKGAFEMMPKRMTGDDLEFVRHSIAKLLEHVVQQQERVGRNVRENEIFQVYTHMLAIEEHKLPVQFKVYYPRKNQRQKGDPHQHIALLLQMDRLGPVRVDFGMAGRHLTIRFFVSNAAVQKRFEMGSEVLSKTLRGHFDDVVLVTRVSNEKIRQFDQQRKDEVPLGRIDIKI